MSYCLHSFCRNKYSSPVFAKPIPNALCIYRENKCLASDRSQTISSWSLSCSGGSKDRQVAVFKSRGRSRTCRSLSLRKQFCNFAFQLHVSDRRDRSHIIAENDEESALVQLGLWWRNGMALMRMMTISQWVRKQLAFHSLNFNSRRTWPFFLSVWLDLFISPTLVSISEW